MDVLLVQSSAFELPSSRRVGAIVHDGTTDLTLWPGAGSDRDLRDAFGEQLSELLDRERERLEGGALGQGEMLRLHNGKLHCDFLLWIASRGPEFEGKRADAPSAEVLRQAVLDALPFVAERNVKRVAFGALGDGPGALDEVERLVLIARAAAEYYEARASEGRDPGLEEVLICHPFSSKISAARRQLGTLVKTVAEPKPAAAKAAKKKATRKKTTRKSTRSKQPRLEEAEVASARASADAYDRAQRYGVGDFFIHTKFGVGRVEELTPEGFIIVLFEGGESKRLLHDRA